MANPFDILPPHIFNLFTTQGFATLQRHYMAILIRIYSLAEFNRFGLARGNSGKFRSLFPDRYKFKRSIYHLFVP